MSKKNKFTKPAIASELSVEELTHKLIEANNKLIETNIRLEQSEKARKATIANLSHDLKSPLSTMIGLIEYLLISDDVLPGEHTETLVQLKSKTLYINSIIEDLSLISTIDSEINDETGHQPTQEPINIYPILNNYLSTIAKSNPDRVFINKLSENPTELLVTISHDRFLRVIDNLVSNAIKFTSNSDSITLGIKAQEKSILIYVKDTGIGIANEHISKVFDRTFKVSTARTPGHSKGSGLGLAIAASIVEMCHGKLWCESSLGNGSTFYIELSLLNH